MKILFDATELSYFEESSGHKAGVYYVALNLLKEFKKLGIDTTLYCDFRRYYFLKQIEYFQEFPLLKEHSVINRLWGLLLYKTRNFPNKIKYALIILARIYDKYLYKTNKKNMEQLKDFEIYFSPFTAPSKEIQNANIKRYRMLHDVIPIIEKGLSKNAKDWHNKIYNTINSTDFYVTNSEYTRQDVLKYFPFIKESNIKTTLLGANENFYPSDEQSIIKNKYIFSLCTLGKRKNILFSIKNFFSFIEKNDIKDTKLVLGGGIWQKFEKELHSTLDKYDASKIILTGYIEEHELKNYYSNALCFIYPSLYEGFGLPVLEAMQCGCPVITSNRSSLPEVISNCGICINPESDDEMVLALEKMYYNEDFRKTCTEKGLGRVKNFSWEKCAKEILQFIIST